MQDNVRGRPVSCTYGGMRFTADAQDCALPMAMDSFSGCTFNCLYCFSNNLSVNPELNWIKRNKMARDVKAKRYPLSALPMRSVEALFARETNNKLANAWYPLMDNRCPIQLGALMDPFDHTEQALGWALDFIPLARRHNYPIRVSTKGGETILMPDYLKAFDGAENFWVAFSIITPDDRLSLLIDRGAPPSSVRLEAMAALSERGVSTSLRFRPMILGASDSTPDHPNAWEELLERAAIAGARAVSCEFGFFEKQRSVHADRYDAIEEAVGNPNLISDQIANSFKSQQCQRGSRAQQTDLFLKLRDKAHELGLIFSVSDPHFKEWNDTGCCCGMEPDDPMFGGYSRSSMAETSYQGRVHHEQGEPYEIGYRDWAPEWGEKVLSNTMVFYSGKTMGKRRFHTWDDLQRNIWNNPSASRAPVLYFEGLWLPTGKVDKNGDLVYRYNHNPGGYY